MLVEQVKKEIPKMLDEVVKEIEKNMMLKVENMSGEVGNLTIRIAEMNDLSL